MTPDLISRAVSSIAPGETTRAAIADFDKVLSIVPDDRNTQQLRQSTLALQAEMARIHDKPAVAAAPPPGQTAVPPPPSAPVGPAAKSLIEQAKRSYDARRYADSIPLLTQALAADPRNDLALRLRYLSYSKLN